VRVLTGTVLPLVLAYGAVLTLLFAARRPVVHDRPARPVAQLLSIGAGGYAVFGAAMAAYCFAQPHGVGRRCVTGALANAGLLALGVLVPAVIYTLIASGRRSHREPGNRGSRQPSV
jgi:hypothetical protein